MGTLKPAAWLLVLVLSVASGCAGAPDEPTGDLSVPGLSTSEDDPFILGRIVDSELLPVRGAHVVSLPGDISGTSDENGSFRLGPLVPAAYTLVVTAAGYAEASAEVRLGPADAEVLIELEPVALDVPYHTTENFVQFFFCSWAAIDGPSSPCLVTENFVHTGLAGDEDRFQFTIPASGLADLLWESDWQVQATGTEIRRALTTQEATSSTGVGAITTWFLIQAGPPVLRVFLVPGVAHPGGNAEFIGDEGTGYTATATVSDDNNTVPYFGIMVNQRVENHLTYFFNREGPRSFTAVPDA